MGLTPLGEHVVRLMGLTPLEDNCGPTLLMGLTPTQSPVKFAAPLMGLTPTRRQLRTHFATGISSTRSPKFANVAAGITPTRRRQSKLTKALCT